MKRLAVFCVLAGCAPAAPEPAWPGTVDAEVDDLTGQRTGVFRTFGPTDNLAAGPDTVRVTVGYWCGIRENTEPVTALDGLFFRLAMPDTTLLTDDQAAFEEASGMLGLLDVARMAVDGRLYAWEYEPAPTFGGWYLYGHQGFRPDPELDTESKRAEILASLRRTRQTLAEATSTSDNMTPNNMTELNALADIFASILRLRRLDRERKTAIREGWTPAHDYVQSHYINRDSVGIELKGVLNFSLDGLGAAVDSVRFWCPITQTHNEWNRERTSYMAAIDSLSNEG